VRRLLRGGLQKAGQLGRGFELRSGIQLLVVNCSAYGNTAAGGFELRNGIQLLERRGEGAERLHKVRLWNSLALRVVSANLEEMGGRP